MKRMLKHLAILACTLPALPALAALQVTESPTAHREAETAKAHRG